VGSIRGQDDRRYEFNDAHWLDRAVKPDIGLDVDFSAENETAKEILPLKSANAVQTEQIAALSAASNGTLYGVLAIVSAVIGFLPGLGVLFLFLAIILGMQARRQGKTRGNQMAVLLGTIALAICVLVVIVDLVTLVSLSALLFGFSSGALK